MKLLKVWLVSNFISIFSIFFFFFGRQLFDGWLYGYLVYINDMTKSTRDFFLCKILYIITIYWNLWEMLCIFKKFIVRLYSIRIHMYVYMYLNIHIFCVCEYEYKKKINTITSTMRLLYSFYLRVTVSNHQ